MVLRKTKSITLLLDAFEKGSDAISTVDLIERLQHKINKTTIYRNLEKLEDKGVLHSFLGKNAIRWYAKCNNCTSRAHKDVHPHFQCLNCGNVDCLPFEMSLPKIPNRKVETSQILIQGTCENCLT